VAHKVKFTLPERNLGNADIVFSAWNDDRKIGTLRISKGAIEWYPKSAKKPKKISWARFERMMDEA